MILKHRGVGLLSLAEAESDVDEYGAMTNVVRLLVC